MRTQTLLRSTCAGALYVTTALANGAATLENSLVRITFDGTRGGAVTSFVDKKTGRDFVKTDAASLYELILGAPATAAVRVTERDAGTVSISHTRTAGLRTVTATALSHGRHAVGVEWSCSLADNAPAMTCRIKVASPSVLVASVNFPALSMPVRLGDAAEDDRLLIPRCDGYVIENPEQVLGGRDQRTAEYPGAASVQLTAFYDETSGLYAAALDPAGHRKSIGFARSGAALGLVVRHQLELVQRPETGVPYPVEIGVIHGDWQAAADAYKKWAIKQEWCRRPLLQRRGRPAWLNDAPLFYTIGVRGRMADGRIGFRGPLLVENVLDWDKALGARVCPVLMAWEKHGTWISPDYFPPAGGDESFRHMTARLAAAGSRPMVYLSGLCWTLLKKRDGVTGHDPGAPPLDTTKLFEEQAARHAIAAEDGKVLRSGKPDSGVGEKAVLCPAETYTRNLLVGIVRECLARGIVAVQLDQWVGGGGPACYSTRHGHAPGGGNWMHRSVQRLLGEMRAEGQRLNRDFIFLIEEPGELYIPYLDAYHARDYAEGRFPRDPRGARGVPLFTYLYHEYALGYGGQLLLSTRESRQNVLSLGLNLINGKIPAAACWGDYLPAQDVHPDQMRLLKDALALLRTPAHDYLLYGERLPTEALDVPRIEIPIGVAGRGGAGWTSELRPFPSVLHSGWALPGGRIGYVAVNIGKVAGTVELPVKARVSGKGRYRLRLFTPGRAEGVELVRDVPLPHRARLKLEPGRPVFVEAVAR